MAILKLVLASFLLNTAFALTMEKDVIFAESVDIIDGAGRDGHCDIMIRNLQPERDDITTVDVVAKSNRIYLDFNSQSDGAHTLSDAPVVMTDSSLKFRAATYSISLWFELRGAIVRSGARKKRIVVEVVNDRFLSEMSYRCVGTVTRES